MGFVDLVNMGFSADWVLRRKMALFPASVSALLLALFRLFSKFLFSFSDDGSFNMKNSCCSMETEALPMKADSDVSKSDGGSAFDDFDEVETPKPKFVFKFEYQTREILSRSSQWNADGDYVVSASGIVSPESKVEEPEQVETNTSKSFELNAGETKVSSFFVEESGAHEESPKNSADGTFKEEPEVTSSGSRYDFKVGKSVRCFMEAAKVASFTVKEVGGDDDSNSGSNSKEVGVYEDIPHESADGECKEEDSLEKKSVIEDTLPGEEQLESQEKDSDGDEFGFSEHQFLSEKDFVASDSDSIGSSLFSDFGFLSEKDFGESDELGALEGTDFQNLDIGYESDCFDEEDEDIMEQLRELEDMPVNDHHNPEEVSTRDEKPKDDLVNSQKSNGDDSSANDFEDSNTLETLWEHQELIEQLKMELKKVKATGLPTIHEESESPNMYDLKPWKIDEKCHIGDKMGELHKFYKSYKERMRKFDILNYQKLYAIGFPQSKDSLEKFSSSKSSTPAIKSFLSQNFLRCKGKKSSDSDPMVKFMRELHSDLEAVYVGQLCLSWEFLQWQYEKAYELWESDPYGICTYNEVAGEFQQFQVLMQRFIENEQYQGPRVENYVKNRCVMRNLLQVPVIRRDSLKDRKKKTRKKGKDDGAITSDILVEVLEESIRTIWRFIRADKQACSSTFVCRKRRREDLPDSDSKLLIEIQTDLQKKEKKLKELMRSENCILKRFRKHEAEEDEGPDHLYFFSQVDIRLVSRILNMSSLTPDQLVWCHNKLSRIHFAKRKIRVDPTFLLFPC